MVGLKSEWLPIDGQSNEQVGRGQEASHEVLQAPNGSDIYVAHKGHIVYTEESIRRQANGDNSGARTIHILVQFSRLPYQSEVRRRSTTYAHIIIIVNGNCTWVS